MHIAWGSECLRQVLAELAEGDYLCLDQGGRITAAYPFSATATPHTAQITGGPVAFSMCAIDALGIAEMLGAGVLVKSADPSTGEPISVAVDGSSAVWEPDTAVVFAGYAARECARPAAAICCGYMNSSPVTQLLRPGPVPTRDHQGHPEPGPGAGSRAADIRAASPLRTRQPAADGESRAARLVLRAQV